MNRHSSQPLGTPAAPTLRRRIGFAAIAGLLLGFTFLLRGTPTVLAQTSGTSISSTSGSVSWDFGPVVAGTVEKSSTTNLPTKKQGKAGEDEEEGSKPRPIPGVGDEAFWVGGPIAGALYVLRGNNFIRISLGGVRAVPERIEKSVRLARAALARM